ncbi:Ig-like domain-containing protein [Pediococcus pentosaceus]|uniref:Ig-like domain-containing protein n=1 Tax=Pediococcus pentosaceus TaxID=1255 RepID=UPI002D80BD59|nr:Ig-like domain-containing protein [Pediococcus pentosaceus]
MAEDRSKQSLVLFKKDGTKISTGELGTKGVTLTGIAAGTKAAAGDYKLAYTDGTQTSDKVDAPAFTVPDAKVAVTGVTLSQKTASMKVGDTKVITATIAPENATNKEITTTSDNEGVATFGKDGTITAVAVGTANVTVTTVDGGFTASCAVTVAAAE